MECVVCRLNKPSLDFPRRHLNSSKPWCKKCVNDSWANARVQVIDPSKPLIFTQPPNYDDFYPSHMPISFWPNVSNVLDVRADNLESNE